MVHGKKYEQYTKKTVRMSGPSTSELVRNGSIVTPYPSHITDENFPLTQQGNEVLAVLVPVGRENPHESLLSVGLAIPTTEQAIRFASQCKKDPKEITAGKVIVFPHDLPFSKGVQPPAPAWLTLVWKEEKELAELCLYMIPRNNWPKNAYFVGIAS